MKMLLIYPPQWNPTSPYLSVPLLAGQIKAAGYSADTLDINVRFYNHILTGTHLRQCLDTAREIYNNLKETAPDENAETLCDKTEFLRFQKLQSFLSLGSSGLERSDYSCGNTARYTSEYLSLEEIIDSVDSAVRVMKDPIDFYDAEKLFDAKMIIQEALKIASLPFAPNELIWDNYFANPLMKMDWRNIDSQCKDAKVNMFLDFFNVAAKDIAKQNYNCICISVPDLSQLIGAFTLSRILKEKTDAHICIGGNYITQNKADFLNHPELFNEYADSIMFGDGETAVISLAKHFAGEIPLSDVKNIAYMTSDGEIICTSESEKFSMDTVAYADFDGYDFSQYFSPFPVLPVQLGKGCYWGKCTFCDYYYGQQCFDIKSVNNAVRELTYYKQKYGASHFMFIDEAVPPVYYDKLSKAILAAGLKIFYFSFARLEKPFTPEVLKSMYDSGARMLLWGYECHAPRLIKMMNKGIDAELRMDIMKASHDAGIWNNALFIIGYPTETLEEIEQTLSVIRSNRSVINSCTPSNFSLKKNALITNTLTGGSSDAFETNGEFYTVYKDKRTDISQSDRRQIRRQFHLDFITENRKCLWPVQYSDFDHNLLYLSKYGLDYVSSYRSSRDICPMFR